MQKPVEHTVGTLMNLLAQYPVNTPVCLKDADTNWKVPKFYLEFIEGHGVVICPCQYNEMTGFDNK